ncbi:GNAT family N-acetyltransferase [Clostridium sp. SM-530-WT-3G]|uniref:GNAT family N-acetyltransferase n=1 Tax=Clostridium sp. SM-530-WT-3G TaxID=2725303 RepID=UPI00145E2B96|nr:GNAT family N-acetyltransferase [Clostridium sp. SM-530-WT-3G]NME81664.1 GNAT family N-acetyltransferase [Clostridium sp. SM-530-WT-3G]
MKDITIKYIGVKDKLFKQVALLRYKILFEPYHKINKYIYDSLDNISYHLVALDKNKIVGYSRLTNIDGKGKITNVFVIPEYENLKIGHKMLNKHIEKAKKEKFTQLYLNARISTINFYKKAGFVEEGEPYISDKSGLMLQNMIMYC